MNRRATAKPSPLSPMGRNPDTATGPLSARRLQSQTPALVRAAPSGFIVNSTSTPLMPDIPDGVVLDGNVTHIASPKPTVQKKYRE